MTQAHKMLTLEIASVPEREKHVMQQEYLNNIFAGAQGWQS
jgi:hypothetical protein